MGLEVFLNNIDLLFKSIVEHKSVVSFLFFLSVFGTLHLGSYKLAGGDEKKIRVLNIISFSIAVVSAAGIYLIVGESGYSNILKGFAYLFISAFLFVLFVLSNKKLNDITQVGNDENSKRFIEGVVLIILGLFLILSAYFAKKSVYLFFNGS